MRNREVRFAPKHGRRQLDRPCPKGADTVAKVPNGSAAIIPPKNEKSDNRRSIWSQTRYQSRP